MTYIAKLHNILNMNEIYLNECQSMCMERNMTAELFISSERTLIMVLARYVGAVWTCPVSNGQGVNWSSSVRPPDGYVNW